MEGDMFLLGINLIILGLGADILLPSASPIIFYFTGALAILYKLFDANKWNRFFRACNLYVKEDKDYHYPTLLESTSTSYGYCLRFKPVAGLTTKDIIAKQDKLEEFLDAKVEISYWNKKHLYQSL